MRNFAITAAALVACACHSVHAQTFQRLGTCPKLGCVFPPDRANFLAGQEFDIRLEVHSPVNGTEAMNGGVPDENFTFTISKDGGEAKPAYKYFGVEDVEVEKWDFEYFQDLFAQDAGAPTPVNVAGKIYRRVALYEPGEYKAILKYYNGAETVACWKVRKPSGERKAKNVIYFIGDGMAPTMITAARLLGHKMINGEYQSMMAMDEMEAHGLQMTHSIDTFITDSANSATALNAGHKSTVNALNVYVDSSPDPFDDPKFETLAELATRINGQKFGFVSTAYIADATPAAVQAHTRLRGEYGPIIDQYLNGQTNYSWTHAVPEVIMGGGAENFLAPESYQQQDYYKLFADKGFKVVHDKDELNSTSSDEKTLGIFCTGNLDKWLDRNVYPQNTIGNGNSPLVNDEDASNQPSLKQMTLKAIDILSKRSKKDGDNGWLLMSEAASIDKMMHVLDYDRALAELLELDDTIRATIKHLKEIGEFEDTLIVVTSDHGHGFDVYGSADTQYLAKAETDRQKRQAIGTYEQSGHSEYQVQPGQSPTNQTIVYGEQGPNFPVQWNPRYTLAQGLVAFPDHRENFTVRTEGPRVPADEIEGLEGEYDGYFANPKDGINGFLINGTLPVENSQGVHSLTDVRVMASGPGAENFRGVYNSIDVFFKMADVLNLGQTKNVTQGSK